MSAGLKQNAFATEVKNYKRSLYELGDNIGDGDFRQPEGHRLTPLAATYI